MPRMLRSPSSGRRLRKAGSSGWCRRPDRQTSLGRRTRRQVERVLTRSADAASTIMSARSIIWVCVAGQTDWRPSAAAVLVAQSSTPFDGGVEGAQHDDGVEPEATNGPSSNCRGR